jgi:hypothetical protein
MVKFRQEWKNSTNNQFLCNATVSEDQCFYRTEIKKKETFHLEIQKKKDKKKNIATARLMNGGNQYVRR